MDPDRYAGFLRAILESPEDDAPRLVFADALEEEGDPRGEFIRVQCELADVVRTCPCFQCARARGSSVCEPPAAKCPDLRRREAELLTAENFWRWFDEPTARAWPGSPLARVDPPDVLVCYGRPGALREWRLTFRCGFIEAVTLPCAEWLQHGGAVVRATPLARVTLSDLPIGRSELRDPPHRPVWCVWRERCPLWLWDALVPAGGAYAVRRGRIDVMTRDTEAEVREAVSRVCLAFARAARPAPADATELADGPWHRRE
jgi:uncharacterized protein (TIGR02996 family)